MARVPHTTAGVQWPGRQVIHMTWGAPEKLAHDVRLLLWPFTGYR